MSPAARRKFGILLIAIAVVAMIVFQIVMFTQGDSRVIGSGSSGNASWTVTEIRLKISGFYPLSIIICGALGILCLLWPSRKPPKLPK